MGGGQTISRKILLLDIARTSRTTVPRDLPHADNPRALLKRQREEPFGLSQNKAPSMTWFLWNADGMR